MSAAQDKEASVNGATSLYHNKLAQWLLYLVVFALLALMPLIVENSFTLNQLARYTCFAILAMSVSLVWGYGGILSLGQGIAFGLAAYGMGMTMQMQYQHPEYDPIPSFMLTNELERLPMMWEPFWSTTTGLILTLSVPTVFFAVFGALMFQAGVAGVFNSRQGVVGQVDQQLLDLAAIDPHPGTGARVLDLDYGATVPDLSAHHLENLLQQLGCRHHLELERPRLGIGQEVGGQALEAL